MKTALHPQKFLLTLVLAGGLALSAHAAGNETAADAEILKSIRGKDLSFENRYEYVDAWQSDIEAHAADALQSGIHSAKSMRGKNLPGFSLFLAALDPQFIQDVAVIGVPVFTIPKEVYDTIPKGTDVTSVAILDTLFIEYFILREDVVRKQLLGAHVLCRREKQRLMHGGRNVDDEELHILMGALRQEGSSMAQLLGTDTPYQFKSFKLEDVKCYGFRISGEKAIDSTPVGFFSWDTKSPFLDPRFQELFDLALAWRQY